VDPGPDINTHGYFRLGEDVRDFTSNLPLMLIHTFQTREVRRQDYFWVPAHAMVMEPDEAGITALLGTPTVDTTIGIQVRGSSTRNQPKHSYAIEWWDAHGNDDNIKVAGLAKESDWILFAPLRFDRALIRNRIAYELSNRIGRCAPRTRSIELFMVENRAERFHEDDYRGVYTLVEKIKRGENRVAIDKLTAEHTELPDITGGFIFKIDRLGEDATGFNAGGSEGNGRPLSLVYPKEELVTSVQMAYLISYLDDFAAALNAPDHLHPTTGRHYSEWIDVDEWIDHHIINLLTKNPDGLRLSSYFYKPRDGKVKAGPVWDFDRTMGSRDGRDADPEGWHPGSGTAFWTAFWWNQLFNDPEFFDAYWARLDELIQTEFTPERLSALVDEMAAELEGGPAYRNAAKWPDYAHPDGYDAAVRHLRGWLVARSEWIAAHIGIEAP
jgi:hypothetical protein